jgi:hypothetical protein
MTVPDVHEPFALNVPAEAPPIMVLIAQDPVFVGEVPTEINPAPLIGPPAEIYPFVKTSPKSSTVSIPTPILLSIYKAPFRAQRYLPGVVEPFPINFRQAPLVFDVPDKVSNGELPDPEYVSEAMPVSAGEAKGAKDVATNASVATFVELSPGLCVGAVGDPVKAGDPNRA